MKTKAMITRRRGVPRLCWFAFLALLAACGGPPGSPVLAKVDGQEINLRQFLAQAAFNGLGGNPAALTAELRESVLELMVRRRLIIKQGQAQGVELSDQELARSEAKMKRGLDPEAFRRSLVAQGIDEDQWRWVLRQELLKHKSLEAVLADKVRVSAEAVKRYYLQHRRQYQRPAQILAQHAVLPDRRLARRLLQMVGKGQDMTAAAASLGSPLPRAGAVWLSRGHMPEALEHKIFKVRPGRLAGPFKSPYGFHVILVMKKRPGRNLSLAQAAAEIHRLLAGRRKEKLAQQWVGGLRQKAKVWMDPGFLAKGSTGNARR